MNKKEIIQKIFDFLFYSCTIFVKADRNRLKIKKMITVAKETKNKNAESNAIIIHFYGYNDFVVGKQFKDLAKNGSDHPYRLLVELGFIPIGDVTWVKHEAGIK